MKLLSGPGPIEALGDLELFAGTSIALSGDFVVAGALNIQADTGINVNGNLTTTSGDLTLNGNADGISSGESISFTGNRTITSAGGITLSAENGDITGSADVTLDSGGPITIDDPFTSGSLTALADTGINVNGNLTTTSGDLTLNGNADGISSGESISFTGNRTITSAGEITLSAENGDITGSADVTLDSGGPITIDDPFTSGSLSAGANSGININGNITTTAGDLVLNGDANFVSDGTGADKIIFASGVILQSNGWRNTITLSARTGGMEAEGDLSIFTSKGNIFINNDLTVLAAFKFDSSLGSPSNTGSLRVQSSSTILAESMEIISRGLILFGELETLDPNNGIITIIPHNQNKITLDGLAASAGSGSSGCSACSTVLGRDELLNITTGKLIIGDESTDLIYVNWIDPLSIQNIGSVELNALAIGGEISFGNIPSTFNALSAHAANGINVNANITTTSGNLTLDGDFDDTPHSDPVTANDAITIANGVTLTAGTVPLTPATMALDATTGGIIGEGAVTLNATSDITINDDIFTGTVVQGAFTINADTDGDGQSNFILPMGVTINTNGNPLSITANDVFLNGTIDTGAGDITLQVSDGGTIGLIGTNLNTGPDVDTSCGGLNCDFMLAGVELANITTSGTLTIGDNQTTGDMTVRGITLAESGNLTGELVLSTSGTANIEGGSSTFNALSILSDNGINVNADISTILGDLILNGDVDMTRDNAILFSNGITLNASQVLWLRAFLGEINATGDLTLLANRRIEVLDKMSVAGDLFANAYVVPLSSQTAGEFRIGLNGGITAASMDLKARFITLGTTEGFALETFDSLTGTISIEPLAGAPLPAGATSFGDLSIIKTGTLILGGLDTSDISLGDFFTVNIRNLELIAGAPDGEITASSNWTTEGNLSLSAGNQITINSGNLTTMNGDLSLSAPSIILTSGILNASGLISIGKFDAPSNFSANSATLIGGDLAVFGELTGSFSLSASNGGSIGLTNEGIAPDAVSFICGGACGLTVTSEEITGEEFNITTLELQVRDPLAGDIYINGFGDQHIALLLNNTVPNFGGSSKFYLFGEPMTFYSLHSFETRGIHVATDISTTEGALSLRAFSSIEGNLLTFADGVTLTAGSGVLGLHVSGNNGNNIFGEGDLTLLANSNVSITSTTMVSGNLTVDADTNNLGIGELILGRERTVKAAGMDITAADVNLGVEGKLETLDPVNGVITITPSQPGSSVGIDGTLILPGQTSFACGGADCDISLSGDELQNITAGKLVLGGDETGFALASDITSTHSQNIGAVELKALGTSGQIELSNATFNAIRQREQRDDRFGYHISGCGGSDSGCGDGRYYWKC